MISWRYGWQLGRWTHAVAPMADPYPPDGPMAPHARDCDNISSHEEVIMLAIWVTARIKPELRQRFLQAIEVDALGSERDEAGCLRFNVLQDGQDENVYYFYEVYRDQAALEAHRAMPHYAVWRAAVDTLDGPTEAIRCQTVFPAERAYWGKP